MLLGLCAGPQHLLRVHPGVGDGGDQRFLDSQDVRAGGGQRRQLGILLLFPGQGYFLRHLVGE